METEKQGKDRIIHLPEAISCYDEKYRILIEQSSDAILIYSFDGTIHEFNHSCYILLGYSREEYARLKLNDILVGDIVVNQANHTLMQAGNTKALNRYLKRKDGSLLEMEVTVKKLADGKAIAFARDNTERKKAEEDLALAQKKFQAIFDNTAEGIYQSTIDGKFIIANPSMARIFGYDSPAELISAITDISAQLYADADDRKRMTELLFRQEHIENFEVQLFTKGKDIIWVSESTRIVRDENGDISYFEGTLRDITDRKHAEEKVLQTIERYDILAKATSDTIWDWDIINNKMHYNDGIAKIFGYTFSEVENLVDWWKKNIHPDDLQRVSESLEEVFKNKLEHFQLAYHFRCADGSYKYIYDRAFVIYDESKNPTRMIGAMQDVTYEKEEEKRMAKAIIDAQEQERHYIGQELHDNVNQILAGSLLTLNMVKENKTDPGKVVELIELSRDHISKAIDEVRKLSHELAPASFDDISLKDIFESLLSGINLNNHFNISLRFDAIINVVISEDIQINLYRILQEQVKNILKYSAATTIEISVILSGDMVSMRTFDNGKGFDTKETKKGIGLSNIKKRVDTFSGKFMLNSAPGKGCEMIVEIPLHGVE